MLPPISSSNKKVLVIGEFVTAQEAVALSAWVNSHTDSLRLDHFGSGCSPVASLPDPPVMFDELVERARTFLGSIGSSWVVSKTGCQYLVAKQVSGFRTTKPTYTSDLGRQIRFTIILSQPEIGGNVVIDGEEIVLPELCAWICVSGDNIMHMTEIGGGKPKIVCSFGLQDEKDGAFVDTKSAWPLLVSAKGF